MYEEERNSLMRNIAVKILLVLLFGFLLILLFPMPKLETFYDRIFSENIKNMRDAARSYFTVERLPEEVGDKEVITLREMLDKKIILPFVDRDGNLCDATNSYVEVVKMENEYLFKVYLSCSTKTDYIIEHFGCYEICKDPRCDDLTNEDKDIALEHQFKRTVTKQVVDKYKCPSGYTLEGTVCIKTTDKQDVKNSTFTCPTGYTLNKNNNKCEKSVSTTENAKINCASGYTYSTSKKTCERSVIQNVVASTNCPSEYTFNTSTGNCKRTITTTTEMCSSGYTYNEITKKCEKPITLTGTVVTRQVVTGHTSWVCGEKSYTTQQTQMSTSTFTRRYLKTISGFAGCIGIQCSTKYYIYEECRRSQITSAIRECADSSYKYNSSNNTCTKSGVDKDNSTTTCSTGMISGSLCTVASTSTKTPTYSCPSGYILSGNKCNRTTTDTRTPTYSCNRGRLSGTKCRITTTDRKNPKVVCPPTYSKVGGKCYKTTTVEDKKNAIPTYKNEQVTEYRWSKNTIVNGWIKTGKTM